MTTTTTAISATREQPVRCQALAGHGRTRPKTFNDSGICTGCHQAGLDPAGHL